MFGLPDLNLKSLLAILIGILLVAGVVVLRPWVGKGPFKRYEDIADITVSPEEFAGREVRIQGEVRRALFIPALRVSFLLIGDETGEIWYREGGELAADTSSGAPVTIQGVVQREVIIPSVGTSKLAVVKYDRIEDIARYPSDFEGREVLVRGTVKQILSPPTINVTFLLIDDGSGEIWARVPEPMAGEDEKATIEGRIQRELSVPGEGTAPVGILGYDDIVLITENPEDFTARQVLIKGEVQQRISIPVVEFAFIRLAFRTSQKGLICGRMGAPASLWRCSHGQATGRG